MLPKKITQLRTSPRGTLSELYFSIIKKNTLESWMVKAARQLFGNLNIKVKML